MIPYCNIYSSFIQRAYDQIIHDVALQNLKVVFCLDRAGIVGHDGATHHGAYDLSFLRCVPNLIIAAPRDEFQLRNLMFTAQLDKHNFPIAIRYPRGKSTKPKSEICFNELEIGKGVKLKSGTDIAIIAVGTPGNTALKAAENLEKEGILVSVYDMIFIKPLDKELLKDAFSIHKHIITIEDNSIEGGFGSAVVEFANDNDFNVKITRLGIPDSFVEHGTQDELIAECGYDIINLQNTVKKNLKVLISG
jgi:1-deoxy-D-xylulose-5-phosphate synthase